MLVAALVNRTKADLTEVQWDALIRALYSLRIEGKSFDESALPTEWQTRATSWRPRPDSSDITEIADAAEPWGVLVWNMALMSRGGAKGEDNLAYLWELVDRYSIKVALLSETRVAYLKAANGRAEDDRILFAFSEDGIQGRDYWTDPKDVHKLKDRKDWSSAVMSPLGVARLGPDDVRAQSSARRNDPIVDVPFTDSRGGIWVAATVDVGSERITCVSLYGLIEELTDASMHRALSDISPIFADPNHDGPVLLGGDFNIGTGLEDPAERERSRIVLNRIEAYGLVDCLAAWHEREGLPPLEGCRCDPPCHHMLTRLNPQQRGSQKPWQERTPRQVDYLFASEDLADRLVDVIAIPPEEWERYGDHAPIVARFRPD